MPQTNREKELIDTKDSQNSASNKNIKVRNDSRDESNIPKKKRKNPKTTEAQLIEVNPNRYKMYRQQPQDSQESTIENKRY